jgi:hypothetical protein
VDQPRPQSAADALRDQRMHKLQTKLRGSSWIQRIRKHGNLISFAAALFVVFSNANKEINSERLKDLKSSLENAKTEDLRRTDAEDLSNKLDTIIGLTAPHPTEEDQLNLQKERIQNYLLFEKRRLEQMHLLLTALGTNTKDEIEKQRELDNQYEDIFLKVDNSGFAVKESFQSTKDELELLNTNVSNFCADLRERLTKKIEDVQGSYDFAFTLNLFIFPIGIMLALLGQVAKVKTDFDEPV